ncbi:DUF7739 domain-containing protein [Streptomyces microflavus]|uniref:DUF7739 domain-containing protein n=1 Tax=Streptomyces microflavus TaxID=1919 RepID=UPI0036B25C0C
MMIAVSHGADFFGLDHYQGAVLTALAARVSATIPLDQRLAATPLIKALETPADRQFTPSEAAQLSEQLLHVSRDPLTRAGDAATARALADAAARAASDREPWHWTLDPPYGADPGSFFRETASRAVRAPGMDDHGDTAG